MTKQQNYRAGDRSGRLTLLEFAGIERSKLRWFAECDCGKIVKVIASHFKSGRVKSCGCLRNELNKERPRTHGKTDTPAHVSWRAMMDRCYRPSADNYKYYGGRGITVCERWHDFALFYEDMGPRPHHHTIERENVNGNYEPSNCVWLDLSLQNLNKRRDD